MGINLIKKKEAEPKPECNILILDGADVKCRTCGHRGLREHVDAECPLKEKEEIDLFDLGFGGFII